MKVRHLKKRSLSAVLLAAYIKAQRRHERAQARAEKRYLDGLRRNFTTLEEAVAWFQVEAASKAARRGTALQWQLAGLVSDALCGLDRFSTGWPVSLTYANAVVRGLDTRERGVYRCSLLVFDSSARPAWRKVEKTVWARSQEEAERTAVFGLSCESELLSCEVAP